MYYMKKNNYQQSLNAMRISSNKYQTSITQVSNNIKKVSNKVSITFWKYQKSIKQSVEHFLKVSKKYQKSINKVSKQVGEFLSCRSESSNYSQRVSSSQVESSARHGESLFLASRSLLVLDGESCIHRSSRVFLTANLFLAGLSLLVLHGESLLRRPNRVFFMASLFVAGRV